ncbi:MAG: hypothetical protein U9R06_02160 [Patescibacteria group bacterium]|nr:hypothetical protein [Patescibacteria group bacterium]
MEVYKLLNQAKKIWGKEKLSLAQIIVRLGKIYGDICRWERNEKKDQAIHTENELKKELGNLVFSTIKFCDELGHDPGECIDLAIAAQKKYQK